MNLERLAALVEAVSGIVFSAGQLVHLHELMARRAAQLGMSGLPAYVQALEQGRLEAEWQVLLPAITVKESYLFRIPEQFHALGERLLGELVRAREGGELRAWSAGCANGEEPATLAVVLAEAGLAAGSWSILATDVDTRALQQAATGMFSPRAVSQVPAGLLRRYFAPRLDGWQLDPELLRRITFAEVNLVRELLPAIGAPFDLVFLRNVLIYFRPDSQRRVVEAVANNLAANGYLFLGHSESLWQLSARLAPVDLGGCFAYRHAAPADTLALVPAPPGSPGVSPRPRRRGRAPAPGAAGTAHRGTSSPPETAAPRHRQEGLVPRLDAAVAALGRNDLALALELAGQRAAEEPADAAAHALLGLLADLAGDREVAIAAYRAALFLRPGLYRVRFRLAESLRAAGWRDRARAEYRQVLATLEQGSEELPELSSLLAGDGMDVAAGCRAALARG